ncbi:MAG: hypothetical protein Q9159_002531 [Coniocarpon cinnabarinum]
MEQRTPAQSPSPDRRLGKLLKTTSRQSTSASSTPSLTPVDSNLDQSGFRKSFDRGIASLKDKARRDSEPSNARRSSLDSRRPKRLSRLVPRRSKTKLRDGDNNDSSPEYSPVNERSPSLRPGKSDASSKLNLPSENASSESFSKSASSLLTDDSEAERPQSRPELASRASHKGYLTFSSPLIAAETVDPPQTSQQSSLAGQVLQDNKRLAENTSLEAISGANTAQSTSKAPTKASTFSNPDQQRPSSSASSKPSFKINTFPTERPDTPSTLITPPTPVVASSSSSPRSSPTRKSRGPAALEDLPTKPPSAKPRDSLSHRRVRSATTASSKSGGISTPLTPHVEEAKTPGGTVVQPSGSSGFLASVFSATQNAVNQISNSFNTQQAASRSRSGTASSAPSKQGDLVARPVTTERSETTRKDRDDFVPEKKEPAIATLGSGNLSLTHLGITDSASEVGVMSNGPGSNISGPRQRASMPNGASHVGAPSITPSEASAVEATVATAHGGKTPSEKSVPIIFDNNEDGARPRSLSSLPSVINGEGTPQRSVTQGTDATDGASLRRAGSVRSRISGRRLRHRNSSAAGGAIASALAASHGVIANPANRRPTGFAVANTKRNREFHKDFKSVPEDDHLIDDFSAALQREILIQGRFYISEQHICFGSNILGWTTSLVMSFDEVVAIEKKSTAIIFPNAIVIQTLHAKNIFASFLNRDATYDLLIRMWRIGHPNLKSTETGHLLDEAAADRAEMVHSPDSTASSDDESDDDDGDEDGEDHEDGTSSVGRPPSIAPEEGTEAVRVVSKAPTINGPSSVQTNGTAVKTGDGAVSNVTPNQDFPGPATHSITQCADTDTHYSNQVLDTTVPAPLGRIYNMWFGPESGKIMKKFLVDDQKSTELLMEDDGKGLGEEKKSFAYSYIKPLGPIEKGANDGQAQYGKDIAAFWRAQLAARSPAKPAKPGKPKSKKKKATIDAGNSDDAIDTSKTTGTVSGTSAGGGAFAALSGLLGPAGDVLGPLLSPSILLSVLLAIMTILYWRQSYNGVSSSDRLGLAGLTSSARLAAYDQLWHREESQLWEWLEDRLRLDDVSKPVSIPSDGNTVLKSMTDRQVDDAIRVTEERLQALKGMVQRKRGTARTDNPSSDDDK